MKDAAELRTLISEIVTWKRRDKRAPNKPLTLLLALSDLQRGSDRLLLFEAIEERLQEALERFGPARRRPAPEYAFWRLQNDGLWEVVADGNLVARKSNTDPKVTELRAHHARAGFTRYVFELLRSNRDIQASAIHQILDAHFPQSIHEDIIAFCGLRLGEPETADRVASSQFRTSVLDAYEHRCAVSGFALTLDKAPVGLEAAHICWPQAGGLNHVVNGLALTTLHRKLFHLGAFTVDPEYRVRVSSRASANNRCPEILHRFDGQRICLPPDTKDHPSRRCLEWHAREVFRA